MIHFKPMDEFSRLLANFPGSLESARQLRTRNPEDNDNIKIAIVGFSYHQDPEQWGYGHFGLIRDRCARDLSDVALREHGKSSTIFRRFSCLALGALLGLYDSKQIDDAGFQFGDALLPGFMYAQLPLIFELDSA